MKSMTRQVVFTIFILLITFTVSGCGKKESVSYKKVIPKSKSDQVAKWINDVVDSSYRYGNNGGDLDDPEDVVRQAGWSATDIFGELTIGIYVSDMGGFGIFIPYDDCSPRQKKICDDFKKMGP